MGTALIVEDQFPEQADLVTRILSSRAFRPIVAGDGEDRPPLWCGSITPTSSCWT